VCHQSAIAHFARERDGLRQVSSVLDDATGLARSSLDSLYRQRDILKGVHQKMIGVAASLGVSQNVLRAIERKETFNAMLTYGGMVLTLVVVWLFYRYWTGK
jgi:Golgi SNAP receptor complex protein 2